MRWPVLIQARLHSTRMPCKIMLAMPYHGADLAIVEVCRRRLVEWNPVTVCPERDVEIIQRVVDGPVVGGSEEDVLSRYVENARAEYVYRVTADCALICSESLVIAETERQKNPGHDYYGAIWHEGEWPEGVGVELLRTQALVDRMAVASSIEREHVTLGLTDRVYCDSPIPSRKKISIDTIEDYVAVYELMLHKKCDTLQEVVDGADNLPRYNEDHRLRIQDLLTGPPPFARDPQ